MKTSEQHTKVLIDLLKKLNVPFTIGIVDHQWMSSSSVFIGFLGDLTMQQEIKDFCIRMSKRRGSKN